MKLELIFSRQGFPSDQIRLSLGRKLQRAISRTWNFPSETDVTATFAMCGLR
jgi:hypothetical protein